MNRKQPGIAPIVCFTVIFGIAAIVLLIVGLTLLEGNSDVAFLLLAFAGICLVAALMLFIMIFVVKSQRNKQNRNLSDPDSIANKVMGENSKFTHFLIIPDAHSQSVGNVATNVAGVAASIFLGIGFIKWGKKMLDAFVSDNEFIINTANRSTFDNSNFVCYNSDQIININFESLSRYERITVFFSNDSMMCFDIKTSSDDDRQFIYDTFGKLLKRPVTVGVAPVHD